MANEDVDKTQGGQAILFTKVKYYASIIGVVLSIILNLGAVFYWGGQLKAEFKSHTDNLDIHNTSQINERAIKDALKDYMRTALINEKFNNLKDDVVEMKQDLKDIKELLHKLNRKQEN